MRESLKRQPDESEPMARASKHQRADDDTGAEMQSAHATAQATSRTADETDDTDTDARGHERCPASRGVRFTTPSLCHSRSLALSLSLSFPLFEKTLSLEYSEERESFSHTVC